MKMTNSSRIMVQMISKSKTIQIKIQRMHHQTFLLQIGMRKTNRWAPIHISPIESSKMSTIKAGIS